MAPKWWSIFVLCVAICRILDALPIDSQLAETDGQETLASQEKSMLEVQSESEDSQRHLVREKRTVGFLRHMFPTLSQIIDRKIQVITRFLFRVIGRLILRGGAAGGGGGGGGGEDGDGGRRIQITLPTFPPSTDDEEETEETPTTTQAPSGDESPTTEPDDSDNQVSESRLSPAFVRKVREAQRPQQVEEEEEEEEDDQAAEATGDNELSEAVDEDGEGAEEQVAEGSEDDPRNKRLVNFSLGGSGGSGGGSGNFLFDIIRRAADRAARMAGTVYRVLAGTDDVGLPTYPPTTASNKHTRALIAGSGTSQAQDEAENAPVDDANVTVTAKDDGYGPAVPGPLTRLFVIANRGIANLIQDLILRIAQTSERIVNFKARLITSII